MYIENSSTRQQSFSNLNMRHESGPHLNMSITMFDNIDKAVGA
jgi:hypothetical protein